MQTLKSDYGTLLTEGELHYRKRLVSEWVVCPIAQEYLSVWEGEILYINGEDYFISNKGLTTLKKIFGDKFIVERIISYD